MSAMSMISQHIQALLSCSDVVKLESVDAPGWSWEVVNHIDSDYFTCKVISPVCPSGEWGEVDFRKVSEAISLMTV